MTASSTSRQVRRLVHVIHSGVVGGGPRMVFALATHFNHGLWRSTVICSDDGPLGADLRAAGVEVIPIPLATVRQCVRSFPTLMRTLNSLSPDLVHTHGQFAGFFGNLAARGTRRKPVVYTAHFPSFITDWDTRRKVRNYVAERISCLGIDALICVSESDRQEYIRRHLIDPCKASTIYNGVDVQRFEGPVDKTALCRSLGLVEADYSSLLGFFGRLADQKGVEYLIQAIPFITAHQPACRFLIVGDGPERDRLERLAKSLQVRDLVHFLGMRNDVAALMALTDVIVVPSLFEPFGIAAVEAMASGRAVVASDVEGLREVVADGVTGILVPSRDPKTLAQVLNALLAKPDYARSLGQAGRQRAEALFSQERMFAEYERLYNRVLGLAE